MKVKTSIPEGMMVHDGDLFITGEYKAPLRKGYSRIYRRIDTGRKFRSCLRHGEFTFPGGYEMFFVCNDGGLLCFDCARENAVGIMESIRGYKKYRTDDGWLVVGVDIVQDATETCSHCDREI